jgi:hypothetical protein
MPISRKRKKKGQTRKDGSRLKYRETPELVSMRNTLNHLEQIERDLRKKQLEETEENNGR